MTAASARRAPEAAGPARPALRVLTECEHCQASLTEVRDRAGKPVRIDADAGKAIRTPDGEWWAAKLGNGQWCVVCPQLGEDPPTSGGGIRYSEHRCGDALAEYTLRTRFGAVDVEPEPEAVEPVLVPPGAVAPDAVRRPAVRGQGLTGPECAERRLLLQHPPGGGPPYSRMCVRCGRITARADGDEMPWCGGLLRGRREEGAAGV